MLRSAGKQPYDDVRMVWSELKRPYLTAVFKNLDHYSGEVRCVCAWDMNE